MAEFMCCKIPCFKHILLNTFWWMCLKYENYSLRHLILEIQTTFTLQELFMKTYDGITKKMKAASEWMFLIVSRSDVTDFASPFFFLRAQSHAQVKLRVRKIGSVEVQLPRPDAIFLTWWVKPLIPNFPLKTKNIYFLILSCDMT